LAFILLSSVVPVLALAADSEPEGNTADPSNVTITVVIPEPAPAPVSEPSVPAFINVYPSDVTETRENGGRQIVKTYDLNADENPADIPREDFERDGWRYTLTDITRRETAAADTRERIEVVTVNTDTKELEAILPLLAPTLEFTDEDGYIGILTLDIASIKVEAAGTKTSSYTMTVTREYPHLSSNDTALVPKTVEEKGKTYALADIDWRAGNTVAVDYDSLPEYFTAVANYTATGTSTKVTGYTTTAEYAGSLTKLLQGRTFYTAYFLGTEIVPEKIPLDVVDETPSVSQETPEQAATAEPTGAPITTTEPVIDSDITKQNHSGEWLVIIPFVGIVCGVAYYFIKKMRKKKEETTIEKTHNPAVDAGDDGGNDCPYTRRD
jgi:hypothetical protein